MISPRTKRILSYITVWILSVGIGTYLRLYPLLTHNEFNTTEKATVFVLAQIRTSVLDSVNKNFPNVSVDQKNAMIKRNIDRIMRHEREMIQKTIRKVAQEIKSKESTNETDKQSPYLLASDGYYYYHLTENILETGSMSDTIKGSKYFNKLMLAPFGYWEPFKLHPYVGFWVYKVVHFFNPSASLMYGVSFTALVLTAAAMIPFLILCYSFGCSGLTSFVSSIFFLTAPILLKRTMFAWYDDDGYNLIFPLTLLVLLFYGLRNRHSFKKGMLYIVACAFTMMLYSLFWHGWMFLFTVVAASLAAYFAYTHFFVKDKTDSKTLLIYFGILAGGSFLGIGLVFGFGEFFKLFEEGWVAMTNFLIPRFSLWPDLYIGVGELHKPTLTYLVELVGGYFFFGVGLFGLATLWWKKDTFAAIILTVFFLGAFFLASGALRFGLLCVLPLGVMFPVGLQQLFDQLAKFLQKAFPQKRHNPLVISFLVLIISLGLVFPRLQSTYKEIPSLLNKIFNSTWEKALVKIREESPPESIVNAWWPPGHFIKAIARRAVTFDGATINKPQGYWMANVFLSDDEREAVGILRMLNNSGNEATEFLQAQGMKLSEAVSLLKTILRLNENEAGTILSKKFNSEQVTKLLTLTHKQPPPGYILLYNDVVEKNLEFKFIGGWNFEKIEKLTDNPNLLKNMPAKDSRAFIQFLWDIAGGPQKYSGVLSELSRQGDLATFENGVKIDLSTKQCHVTSSKFGKGVPYSIFYIENDRVKELVLPDSSLSFSVILSQDEQIYNAVLLDRSLARSLMTNLYFFDGKGLKYLKPFAKEKDLTRRTQIFVYEIDWKKFLKENY